LRIGIDASIYIFFALKNLKILDELAVDFALEYDISFYLHSYFESLRHFLVVQCDCDIMLVFDGFPHPNKAETQEARRRICIFFYQQKNNH
jgi:hypothetical protein